MTILMQSENLTPRDIYNMSKNISSEPVSNIEDGSTITVNQYLIVERSELDKPKILYFTTNDNRIYATNSSPFITEFEDIIMTFGTVTAIKVFRQKSKSNRTYHTCRAVL